MAEPESQYSQDGGGQQRGPSRFFGRRVNLQTPTEALHPATPPPPPSRPNSQRRPMLSAASGILTFVTIMAVAGVGFLSFASSKLAHPGPLASDKVVYIAPRTEVSEIIDQLQKAGVIDQPTVLKAALVIDRKWSKVRAGEYLFKQRASLNDVIDTLVAGRQVLHSITIPEGLTSEQIVERLRQNELLAGDIVDIPPEGSLLPETYRVRRGEPRASLIRLMRDQQTRLLDRIWERRGQDLPVRSKIELLTLASIVEKETGRADERTRVAAVFYNRLRRGMKLQSDPTIVYGLVGGKGTLGRPIQRAEITKPTKYNTYVIPALPPGPIANPGRAALEAAANPSRTSDLFFVANGTGGHTFAETLDQHNRNVQRWREIEKQRAASQSQTAPDAEAVDRVDPAAQETQPVPAPAPARTRRRRGAEVDNGVFFGNLPGAITGATVAIAELPRALSAAALRSPVKRAAETAPKTVARIPDSGKPPPASVMAYAPVKPEASVSSVAKSEPSSKATAVKPPEPSRFVPGKGIEDLGIEIAGVFTAPGASPLDGPADDSPAAGAPNMETFPLAAARRSEMNARAAMYGAGVAPVGPIETALTGETAGPVRQAQAHRQSRPRAFDASEGTALDPLRSKGWDLNSAHSIPAPVPVPRVR